ncbi:MAG: flagellar basal body L-ring protein FlgH [Pseudomonadota bacterium]
MKHLNLILASCLALTSGCERLSNVGQEPEFTAAGAPAKTFDFAVSDARRAVAVPAQRPVAQGAARSSLWDAGPASLLGDRRARGTGDILTVVIEIDDEAEISNSSQRDRSASENLALPQFLGVPQILRNSLPGDATFSNLADAASTSASAGAGRVQRNEKITLRVAATVVDQLPNGHLVISGTQEVRVNFELRDLRVAGIVRPEDISRRNEITYDKISDARVAYGGRGIISDVQQPRYGQQIADIILPY